MERLRVSRELTLLFTLGNARGSASRRLIPQITAGQVDAMSEMMRRLTARSIIIYQLAAYIFEDHSRHVNKRREKNASLRHHYLLARVIRSQYIYQTIAAEISDTIYMADELRPVHKKLK
jgi:hypothetical protein